MKSRRSLYSIVVEPYNPIQLDKQLKRQSSIINDLYGGSPRFNFPIGENRGVLVVMISDENVNKLAGANFDWVKRIRRGYYDINWFSVVK